MHPEFIPGFAIPIHSYGLMLVVAFYSGYFLARRLGRRDGIDPNRMTDILLIGLVLGIVGSRAFYVIQYGADGFLDFFAIWRGGLVFYGGLLAATAGLMFYIIWKRLPLWRIADATAPAIMLGAALGRIGCFFNGCCWGAVCDEAFPAAVRFPRFVVSTAASGCRVPRIESVPVPADGRWHAVVRKPLGDEVMSPDELRRFLADRPNAWRTLRVTWARADRLPDGSTACQFITGSYAFLQHLVEFPERIGPDAMRSLPVYPTQLFSSGEALLVCIATLSWRRWRRRPGEVFALMAALYAVGRFTNEFMRNDTNPVWAGLTIGQLLSIGVFVAGVFGFVWFRWLAASRRTSKDAGK